MFSSSSIVCADEKEAKPVPHVVFVLTDAGTTGDSALSQCERLTIQGYRDRGVKVTELSRAEMDRWLEGEGKAHTKAHKHFQYMAIAKSRGADAIGGLISEDVTPEHFLGQAGVEAGTYFYSWGLSLSGVSHNFMIRLEGRGDVRAVPMNLGEEGDPWAVPLRIDAKPCVAMDRTSVRDSAAKGRPFVGVQMKGNVLSAVLPETPAAAAGLQVGDKMLSFHGHAITQLADLQEVLQGLTAGTEVELEVERDGAAMKKRITLADYHDAVEAKEVREGTALPDLTGKDINGREVRVGDFKGKVVLMDFWATWCGPCLEEMPLLQLLWEKAKGDDFVWISVSVDDDKGAWENYVRNNGLGGIQLRSPEWAGGLRVSGYPTILLVDRSGIIRCDLRGSSIAQAVMALMAEK